MSKHFEDNMPYLGKDTFTDKAQAYWKWAKRTARSGSEAAYCDTQLAKLKDTLVKENYEDLEKENLLLRNEITRLRKRIGALEQMAANYECPDKMGS